MNTSKFSCSRRTFLLGTAATVAGAFLAACGTEASEEIAATEVPVGSAVFVGDIIIAQPTEGTFVAYSRSCPHQGQTIDKIEGDSVRCSAHNSKFSLADGSVIQGPARDPMVAGEATESDGNVIASV